MRSFLRTTALLAALAVTALAQQSEHDYVAEAEAAYIAGEYAHAAALFETAILAGQLSAPVLYNTACCYALTGRADRAFECLDRAFAAGWRDVEHVQNDADLKSLHEDSRWPEAIKKCTTARERFRQSLKKPELYDELIRRMQADQRVRQGPTADPAEMRRIDDDNTAWLKRVVADHGWPTISLVGEEGELAAFLIIQHASPKQELEFQKKCLDLMKAALEKKDVRATSVAYLTDRVLMYEGKPQVYGTQFVLKDGTYQPHPIEDEEHVDARRAALGLPPMAETKAQMRALAPTPTQPASQPATRPASQPTSQPASDRANRPG